MSLESINLPHSLPGEPATLQGAGPYERLYFQALRIRMAEERIAELYPSDKIQSPVHLSIGQEAIAVGICSVLKQTDMVFGSYRSHAAYLAKGGNMGKMFAELYGKKTGCGEGKAGSMHLSDPAVNVMGSSAVVAGTIPHAVGAAFGAQFHKKGQIVVSFFGEGATAEGSYHESLNFAASRKLPLLLVCENNNLAIFTRVSELHSFSVAAHARTYGIEVIEIENGMDFVQVAKETRRAEEMLRSGKVGPVLLEIQTYRYRQHVGPVEDYNVGYRSIAELEAWLQKDPLHTDPKLAERFRPHIEKEINEAIHFAETSPFPDETDLLKDVF